MKLFKVNFGLTKQDLWTDIKDLIRTKDRKTSLNHICQNCKMKYFFFMSNNLTFANSSLT